MTEDHINIDADPLNADWLRVLSIGRELGAMEDVSQLPAVKHAHLDHPLVKELMESEGYAP